MMVSRNQGITIFWFLAFFALMGAGCGTFSITVDGQSTEELDADRTVVALQTEISILSTLVPPTSSQATVTPETVQSTQTKEASMQWSMNPIAGLLYRTDRALWQLDSDT